MMDRYHLVADSNDPPLLGCWKGAKELCGSNSLHDGMLRAVDGWNPVPVKGDGFFIGPLSHYSQSFQWRSPEIQPQCWVPNHGTYPSDAFPNNRGSGKWPFLEVHSLKRTTSLWKEVFPNGKFIFQPPIFQVQHVSFRKATDLKG